MKKSIFALLPLLLLTSCSQQSLTNLTIVSASGAPAIAFYKFVLDSHFETNNEPSNIVAMMAKQTKDVAILPTNAGIQAIVNRNLNYKIAATITFGNLFVAATGNDDDGVMDENDYIVLFQKDSFPDVMFHSVYGNNLDNGIHYVSTAKEAAACLKTGINLSSKNEPVDYVLLAEPALYSILTTTEGRSEYANIQDLYRSKTGGYDVFQASIFISNSANKEDVDNLLSDIKKHVDEGINNPSLIKEELLKSSSSEFVYGCKPEVAESVTRNGNRLGLGFKNAYENKEAIDKFLESFNIGKTNEEIYYK